jgi:hypothetical protein
MAMGTASLYMLWSACAILNGLCEMVEEGWYIGVSLNTGEASLRLMLFTFLDDIALAATGV